jgi:hypothetical protein
MNTCWLKKIIQLGWLLIMGVSMSACSKSWQEEVQLHDGSKIIVKRTVDRGGRHEIGQQSPIKAQSLQFILPVTNKSVIWKTEYSADVGLADFKPILLNFVRGQAYIVTTPMGCLSYNKWGRPNPPYIVFKYEGNEWKRIALLDLPAEITTPNLIISSPDEEAASVGKTLISVEDIKRLNGELTQLEYQTILREPIEPKLAVGSSINCENLVSYKGKWVLPNDPVAREMIDRWSK